uniref:Putative group i salivary lipocalin n=1 Tax=Rhipicephalus pulchellus TaxID=72859 RepID=L7LTC3_RHIPC
MAAFALHFIQVFLCTFPIIVPSSCTFFFLRGEVSNSLEDLHKFLNTDELIKMKWRDNGEAYFCNYWQKNLLKSNTYTYDSFVEKGLTGTKHKAKYPSFATLTPGSNGAVMNTNLIGGGESSAMALVLKSYVHDEKCAVFMYPDKSCVQFVWASSFWQEHSYCDYDYGKICITGTYRPTCR